MKYRKRIKNIVFFRQTSGETSILPTNLFNKSTLNFYENENDINILENLFFEDPFKNVISGKKDIFKSLKTLFNNKILIKINLNC